MLRSVFKSSLTKNEKRNLRNGLLFISPWLIGLLWFYVYPFFSSLFMSLHNTTAFSQGAFIGLENYRELFQDELFWTSLKNTLYFTIVSVFVGNVLALALALLLAQQVAGIAFYRALFYLPSIVPFVAVSVIWLWILHPQYGMVNNAVRSVGLPTIGWFSDPNWSMIALILVSL